MAGLHHERKSRRGEAALLLEGGMWAGAFGREE
jgi:hypothetical protein